MEDGTDPADYRPTDYGKADSIWWVCLPSGDLGRLDEGWKIVEHEDSTVTIDPGFNDPDVWRGYLRRGVWIGS